MPNWVGIVVKFSGNEDDINTVFKEISGEDTKFDFNRLLPMPESLDVESSSVSDLAYAYYLVKKFNCLPNGRFSYAYNNKQEIIDRVEKDINISTQDMFEKGKILYDNKEKYGATNWYDWCCDNWGTKWNACEADTYDNILYFQTAWSFPAPVMRKLAELCAKHNVQIEGEWADEDMGNNTGEFHSFGDGEFSYDYYASCSSEAYSAYVNCMGESDCLDTDENGLWYRHECESCPNRKDCMGE